MNSDGKNGEKAKLTRVNYPERKKECLIKIYATLAVMSAATMGILIVWLAALDVGETSGIVFFTLLSVFSLIVGWYSTSDIIRTGYRELKALNKEYLLILSLKEIELFTKKKKRRQRGFATVIVLFVIILTAVYSFNRSVLIKNYSAAVALYENGAYNEAEEQFKAIEEKNYKDTSAYISLCRAKTSCEQGFYVSAYYELKKAVFKNPSQEQSHEVKVFQNDLKRKYDAYLYEQKKAEEKAFREKIRNGVPFVDMPESEIRNTSLGAPSQDVRHEYEIIGGQRYEAKVYEFRKDNKLIFTARCVKGKVTKVHDYRKTSSNSYTYHYSSGSNSSKDDPYNAKGYSNAEDFYDDNYDDFFDYYDAEDYYNEHN